MTDSTPTLTTLILGAGQAGGEVAVALRQNGYTGRVVLVGEEPHVPYQRPPLSKAYLNGKLGMDALYLRPRESYEKIGVELRLGLTAERINRSNKTVAFSDGGVIGYDKLVFATGGRARRLVATGMEQAERLQNLHYLRTVADVDRIRAQFREGARLVLVGGGYIGLEVAAVARHYGMAVTVLEALPRVLARVTAPEISAFYARIHREAGVDIRVAAAVARIETDVAGTAIESLVCDDGSVVAADLVIIGIGLEPNTALATQAGLAVNNGILVDEPACTEDRDIFAAGDCANQPSSLYGRRLRLESVPNATAQARTVAAAICGQTVPQNPVPWFWSDQYDLKLQMVGLSAGYDRLVVRGSTAARAFSAFYLKEGIVISADTVNRPQEFMLAKRLVAQRCVVDADQLADESVSLKSILESVSC